ncbi:TetR/AcrR family transcriptional regulator [Brevibacterium sp. 50QC2O2]|uniref:TetR/AcrR family transcriptional regulator n=1 Tax=Brevibacterium sp. 50QC2O2 TaxID=2968459 RepID=UPI0027959475|nr:TetR/AcrR family transcriptional regulator [Brevibacterium sp. 50QC2O2]
MRADAKANHDAIIRAAHAQLAAHGADVPLSAVAEAAGVGIATLYRNFPTRDALIRAVLGDMSEVLRGIVARALAALDRDPQTGWRDFVHAVARLRPGALTSVFAAQFVRDDHIPASIEAQRSHSMEAVQGVLDRAREAGLVAPDLTAAKFQMGIASITRPLPDVAAPAIAEHQAWLVDVFLKGLRP